MTFRVKTYIPFLLVLFTLVACALAVFAVSYAFHLEGPLDFKYQVFGPFIAVFWAVLMIFLIAIEYTYSITFDDRVVYTRHLFGRKRHDLIAKLANSRIETTPRAKKQVELFELPTTSGIVIFNPRPYQNGAAIRPYLTANYDLSDEASWTAKLEKQVDPETHAKFLKNRSRAEFYRRKLPMRILAVIFAIYFIGRIVF